MKKSLIVGILTCAVATQAMSADLKDNLVNKYNRYIPTKNCLDLIAAHASSDMDVNISYVKEHIKDLKNEDDRLHLPVNVTFLKDKSVIESTDVTYYDTHPVLKRLSKSIAPYAVHVKFKENTTYKNIPVTDYYYMANPFLSYTYFVSPYSTKSVAAMINQINKDDLKIDPEKDNFMSAASKIQVVDADITKPTMFGCFSQLNDNPIERFDFNMFVYRISEQKDYNPETVSKIWDELKFIDINPESERMILEKIAKPTSKKK